jgi:general stress protein YciG
MAQGQGNGKLAEQTMIERMGLEQYKQFIIERGRRGGAAPYIGKKGFACNPERARMAGAIGGKASKR